MPFMDYVAFQGVVGERMQREIQLLQGSGWEVRIILVHPREWKIGGSEGAHILLPSRLVGNQILDQLLLMPLFILLKYLLGFFSTRRKIGMLYVRNLPDIYSLPFLALGAILRIPTAYDIADPWKEFILTESTSDARRRMRFIFYYTLVSMIEDLALKLASGVIYSSESLMELHTASTRGKPEFLLPNYSIYKKNEDISTNAQQLRRRAGLDGKVVISYIGGFQEYRGIDTLLKSMVAVQKQNPAAKLLLVGAHGETLKSTRSRILELNLEGSCMITGWVQSDEVVLYTAVSDIGVIPYSRTPATELTLPNKLFNYMVLGKPVVISKLKELSRYFEDGTCGLKVEPDNPQDLAEAILTIANDSDLRRRMGKKALSIAKKHNFENLESGFLQFIDQLANQTQRNS